MEVLRLYRRFTHTYLIYIYVYVYTVHIYYILHIYIYTVYTRKIAQVFNFIVDQIVKHDETCWVVIAIFAAMKNICEKQHKEHVGEDL